MSKAHIQRFDIPAKGTMIEGYRDFRSYLEKVAASEGKTLDPVWYRDSPEELPEVYDDQPEVLARLKAKDESSDEASSSNPQDTRPEER